MEINKLLNTGSNHLKNSNIFTHKLDSEILLSKILNQTREKHRKDIKPLRLKTIQILTLILFQKCIFLLQFAFNFHIFKYS